MYKDFDIKIRNIYKKKICSEKYTVSFNYHDFVPKELRHDIISEKELKDAPTYKWTCCAGHGLIYKTDRNNDMFYSQIYAYAHGMYSSVLGDNDAYYQLTNGTYLVEDDYLRCLLSSVKPDTEFKLYSTINIFIESEALNIVFGSSMVSRRLSHNAIIVTGYPKGNYISYSTVIETRGRKLNFIINTHKYDKIESWFKRNGLNIDNYTLCDYTNKSPFTNKIDYFTLSPEIMERRARQMRDFITQTNLFLPI